MESTSAVKVAVVVSKSQKLLYLSLADVSTSTAKFTCLCDVWHWSALPDLFRGP